MSERALLEMAAKAMGYELHVNCVNASQLYKGGEYVRFWAPLEDTSDAMELAAFFDMKLSFRVELLRADCQFDWRGKRYYAEVYYADCGFDKLAAMRLAITLSAHLVGKAMP